jgi:hypothetical protein
VPLAREVNYWGVMADKCVDGKRMLKDNVYKRGDQLQRLLKHSWIDKRVLEIGVGNAVVAGVLKTILLGHMQYVGTELGKGFREHAKLVYGLDIREADVRELPDGEFERIIALDSLEHVRPEHREVGYKRMSEVAAPGCLLFIHFSKSESLHDKEFDHPFGLEDLQALEKVGFNLQTYERYSCPTNKEILDYVFVVMQK